jgi:SanA protein
MKNKKRHFKKILILGIIGLIVILITNYDVNSKTESFIFDSQETMPKTTVGIIFGAGINGDQPSKYLKDRLDAGISLYKNHTIQKILLSGDNGRDEHDELTVMKIYCYKNGVDTTKIYIDYAGFDSYSTMYRAKHLFKIDTAILVSQKYHLARAVYLGNSLGVKSYGFVADVGEYRGHRYVKTREYLSVFKSVVDVFRDREPRFMGDEVNINGLSNYTKEDLKK